MGNNEFEEFSKLVKTDKAGRRLHQLVEKRLRLLLSRLFPNNCAVSEVYGVLGGRNDLIQFAFNGRRAVFELFFSPSQVSQDLRLLEQADAEVKIAILLDSHIDHKLSQDYFRKKPNHFPFLWLSTLMLPSREKVCLTMLRELVDENSSVPRLRRILSSQAGARLEEFFSQYLMRVEAAINGDVASTSANLTKLTVGQLIALLIVAKIRKLGIPVERLRPLYAWLQDSVSLALLLMRCGYQAFLVSDLYQEHAILADGDLADDLILGAEKSNQISIALCLNKIINDVLEANGGKRLPVRRHFLGVYQEEIAKIVPIWAAEGLEAGEKEDTAGS